MSCTLIYVLTCDGCGKQVVENYQLAAVRAEIPRPSRDYYMTGVGDLCQPCWAQASAAARKKLGRSD